MFITTYLLFSNSLQVRIVWGKEVKLVFRLSNLSLQNEALPYTQLFDEFVVFAVRSISACDCTTCGSPIIP